MFAQTFQECSMNVTVPTERQKHSFRYFTQAHTCATAMGIFYHVIFTYRTSCKMILKLFFENMLDITPEGSTVPVGMVIFMKHFRNVSQNIQK